MCRSSRKGVVKEPLRENLRHSPGDSQRVVRPTRLPAEIPWLPVVDVRPGLVEYDARVGPDGAGELVVQAGGEQRPLAAVGVAHHADPARVDPGQVSQRVVAVGRDVSKIGQRLDPGITLTWRDLVGRDTERQGDEAPPGQPRGEVEPSVAKADGRLGLVEQDKHGREWPPPVGDEQVAVHGVIRGDLDPDPPLLEVLPPLGTQDVDPRPLDQRRPGPHDPVPRREDLLAALPPAGRVADGPTIVKGQGRLVRSEVAAELRRRSECPFEWSQR